MRPVQVLALIYAERDARRERERRDRAIDAAVDRYWAQRIAEARAHTAPDGSVTFTFVKG